MNRLRLLISASALALAACAGSKAVDAAPSPPPVEFAPASLVPEPAPTKPAVAAMEPLQGERVKVPASAHRRAAGPPIARVEAANRAAVREPSREAYVNAVQVYAWVEGALYRLYTAPERVSEIALQPGEALISVAAGDTARWVIGDTTSGTGAARRTHILVKPTAVGLRTNLVISTDRRVYHVELQSNSGTGMASISWTYPQDALLALSRAEGAAPPLLSAAGANLESLNFGYSIEGDNPSWRPVRAFDDGTQVFIEFPANLAQGEAPPLFVRGTSGRAELVNYRVRGLYYVVDRLFAAAELRLGERRQQVVRIVRTDAKRRGRGRSS
jgi:type IV secretion system protein VirB9